LVLFYFSVLFFLCAGNFFFFTCHVVLHCASRVKNGNSSRSKSNLIYSRACVHLPHMSKSGNSPHVLALGGDLIKKSNQSKTQNLQRDLIKKSQRSCPKFCFQTVIKSKLIRYKPNGSSAGFLFGNETTDQPSERLTLLDALNQVFSVGRVSHTVQNTRAL
jgi:hypothetical protein